MDPRYEAAQAKNDAKCTGWDFRPEVQSRGSIWLVIAAVGFVLIGMAVCAARFA